MIGLSTTCSCPRVSGFNMVMVVLCGKTGSVVPHRATIPPTIVLTALAGVAPSWRSLPDTGLTYHCACVNTDMVISFKWQQTGIRFADFEARCWHRGSRG